MENPDLVLQETGTRPTYSRLNYVPSGDTLRRDAISSFKDCTLTRLLTYLNYTDGLICNYKDVAKYAYFSFLFSDAYF